MSEEEVKDPQGLLKAYRQLQEDIVAVRKERDELQEAGSEEVINKWKTRALQAEAKFAVQGTGVKDSERVLKYLNLDGVDFDEKGEVTGLKEKLEEIKKDFPELFDAKKRAGRTSVDIHEGKPTERKRTGTEAQVERIFSKSA